MKKQFLAAEEQVVCKICNKTFKMITAGHIKNHGLTVEEYRTKFGIFKGYLACKSTRIMCQIANEKRKTPRIWVNKCPPEIARLGLKVENAKKEELSRIHRETGYQIWATADEEKQERMNNFKKNKRRKK